jgi:hypothetical protein
MLDPLKQQLFEIATVLVEISKIQQEQTASNITKQRISCAVKSLGEFIDETKQENPSE